MTGITLDKVEFIGWIMAQLPARKIDHSDWSTCVVGDWLRVVLHNDKAKVEANCYNTEQIGLSPGSTDGYDAALFKAIHVVKGQSGNTNVAIYGQVQDNIRQVAKDNPEWQVIL